jgi:hypothetical protein
MHSIGVRYRRSKALCASRPVRLRSAVEERAVLEVSSGVGRHEGALRDHPFSIASQRFENAMRQPRSVPLAGQLLRNLRVEQGEAAFRPCTHKPGSQMRRSYVCFVPQATMFVRQRDMSRWATSRSRPRIGHRGDGRVLEIEKLQATYLTSVAICSAVGPLQDVQFTLPDLTVQAA